MRRSLVLGFLFLCRLGLREQIDDELDQFEKKVKSLAEVVDCWLNDRQT
ncbi:MAG: hypothetical protein ACJZ9G_06155 [Rhodospirillales bacterium]